MGYDSNTGNGLGGLGWNLEFSSIKRQIDKGFPEHTSADTFLYQGEELVPLDNAGGDWRCENDRGFQRLRQVDADKDGLPDSWEVTEKNGTRHSFGRFHGAGGVWSAVENPDKVASPIFDRTYCWMLDSTTDLHGNVIRYEYLQGTGVLYPARVTYSEREGVMHEVVFFYEDRPDAFDDYRPAFSARLDRRIRRIEVLTQGQLVRAYGFAYSYAEGDLTAEVTNAQANYLDLGVSLLKRVTQYDRSGGDANYLPPLIFTYAGLDLVRAKLCSLAATPGLDLADPNGRVQLVDLDGDGLPDLYSTRQTGAGVTQFVALNRGETNAPGGRALAFAEVVQVPGPAPLDLAQPDTIVHDPKGKGLVDLSSLLTDGGNKRLETFANLAHLDEVDPNRLGFSVNDIERISLVNPPAYVSYSGARTRQMDANFDKRGDFVNLEPGFGGMKFNSFYRGRQGAWIESQATLPLSYPLANTFDGPDGAPNPCVHLADMNGDRLMDLICLAPEQVGGSARIRVSYWPLSGLGRYGEERSMQALPTDSFEVPGADLRDVLIEDFTGDGLADVVILDGSGEKTVLQLRVNIAGQRWSPPFKREGLPRYKPRDPNQPTVLRTADLNGNGSVDLLFVNLGTSWSYLELLPDGKPSLLTGIDNSIGKRTTIVYGSAEEDAQRARSTGHPWRTVAPIALQVVRQIRVRCGQDLNGDGNEDAAVAEFHYRDPFYDGYEREFRGFSFAERVDYGDDFLFEPTTGLMRVSEGWNRGKTPTGQVSGPSLVTRYRFHTGAADQQDNDDYGSEVPLATFTDEFTEVGGHEEESLKGVLLVEEKVDPVVLHSALDGGFDAGCDKVAAAKTANAQHELTPSSYVYSRSASDWVIRRLYRPAEALPYLADQNGDGIFEDYRTEPAVPRPEGRFGAEGIHVIRGNGRSVSFPYQRSQRTEVHEANGLLSSTLNYPVRPLRVTRKEFNFDDYGNPTVTKDWGLEEAGIDDERFITTSYALGGNALRVWVIDRPLVTEVTDENGAFVSRKVNYYDGEPFIGLKGIIEARALLHRTEEFISDTQSVSATRSKFDAFGNLVESRDPNGNVRRVVWDEVFKTYPVREEIVVGDDLPDLVASAAYDLGFGVVTSATNFNGHATGYRYDSFGRLVKIIQPGDTVEFPTASFEYQPADPVRGRAFAYDAAGNLTVQVVALGSMSRVTTRQREQAGTDGEFISAKFTDGCGKALASIEESDTPGKWVVKAATSYNLRQKPKGTWQPYLVDSLGIPQFTVLWPSGRPPPSDGFSPEIHASEIQTDPLGREIRTTMVPESWGGLRRFSLGQYLPFETVLLDAEDTRTDSSHFNTPYVQHRDGLGRLVQVEEQVRLTDLGEEGPAVAWQTRYAYDLNDQLTRIQDSQGNVKRMAYDGLKRMTSMDDPDRGAMTLRYDAASNLKESLDARGQIIAYTYDGANRIKTEDYRDGGPVEYDVEYFYDVPVSNLDFGDGTRGQGTNAKGQLAYIRDRSGETHFSYDARARVEWEIKRIPDAVTGNLVSYRTEYGYDSADRLRRLGYPDGDEVTQDYNSRSQLQRVYGGSLGDVVRSIAYRPSGQLDSIGYGNGVQTRYAYDPRLRLTRLQTTNTQGAALIDLEYQFDAASNIERISDRRQLQAQADASKRFNTQILGYDNLYRLTSVRYPSLVSGQATNHVSYRYDRIGNMLSQESSLTDQSEGRPLANLGQMESGGSAGRFNRVGRSPNDPPGPHALSAIINAKAGVAKRDFAYDANGNMTRMDGLTNTWDFKDRLIAVENAAMRAVYTYDYADRRISKQVYPKAAGAVPTSVAYVNRYFEVREHDSMVKYVWQGDIRVARVTAPLSAGLRIQRLRLLAGWNQVCLTVGGVFPQLTPGLNQNIGASALSSTEAGQAGLVEITAATTVPAGVTAWIYANRDVVVVLRGTPAAGTLPVLTGGSQFIGNVFLEPISLPEVPPVSLWLARYDSIGQKWQHWFGQAELAGVTDDPGFRRLLPGQALWTRGGKDNLLPANFLSLQVRYYHQDHLGSTAVTSDAEGNLVSETANFAFGQPRNEFTSKSLKDPYQFTQKERDAETGLNYFEARYLGTAIGRFLSVDPITHIDTPPILLEPQRLNIYGYCENRPFSNVDPSGRVSVELAKYGATSIAVGVVGIALAIPTGGASLGVASAITLSGAITGTALGSAALFASAFTNEKEGVEAKKGFEMASAVSSLAKAPFALADFQGFGKYSGIKGAVSKAFTMLDKASTFTGAAKNSADVASALNPGDQRLKQLSSNLGLAQSIMDVISAKNISSDISDFEGLQAAGRILESSSRLGSSVLESSQNEMPAKQDQSPK
jgi:RHS repeat-associated protein